MDPEQAQAIGSGFIVVTTLLGTWFLALRIREQLTARPDPKLAWATRTDLDAVRGQLAGLQREARSEREAGELRLGSGLSGAHELIRKNAEHIAALIAYTESMGQRLTEVVGRVDRLQERTVGNAKG